MKLFLLTTTFFLSASFVSAYNPEVANPERPFDVIAVQGDLLKQQEFLGNLNNFPEMYEVSVTEPTEFAVQVRQDASKEIQPVGLIVVRLDDRGRGVTEVVRLNQSPAEWDSFFSKSLGMSFAENKQLKFRLEPGTYRIEVSAPNNLADYLVVFGVEPKSAGYFSMLASVYRTQSHFGHSLFRVFLSPYYYIPLLVLVFGVSFFAVRRRNKIYA